MNGIRLRHFACEDRDALAIVDPTGQHWSRQRLAETANKFSRALRSLGLVPGDVVAVMLPNSAEYLVAYLAATQIGAYVVPINWHLAPPELGYIIGNSAAKVLVAHQRFGNAIRSILIGHNGNPKFIGVSVGGRIPGFIGFEDFTSMHSGSEISDPVEGRVLSYTSATTGSPKGVVLPLDRADTALDSAIERRIAVGTRPKEHVFLCYSMLYHGAPLENVTVSLHMGQSVVLTQYFGPEHLLQLIDRYAVTQAFVVPTMFARLLQLDSTTRSKYSTASLQRVFHGGAACPPEVKQRMIEWWGPVLWEAYGATEGGGTVVSSLDWLKHPGTVGKPIPNTRILIIGESGEELPTGVPGLIYMTRYSGDRFEYLGDPEKTRAAYRGDFFTVGDIGYLDDEGFLFICGRKIDMINLSGAKIYPAEIEGIYSQHPGVGDCAVFGIPDSVHGEVIVALIQPVSPLMPPHELKLELAVFLSKHVAAYKFPRYVEIVSDLGRDATGKLRKSQLRREFLAASKPSLN